MPLPCMTFQCSKIERLVLAAQTRTPVKSTRQALPCALRYSRGSRDLPPTFTPVSQAAAFIAGRQIRARAKVAGRSLTLQARYTKT